MCNGCRATRAMRPDEIQSGELSDEMLPEPTFDPTPRSRLPLGLVIFLTVVISLTAGLAAGLLIAMK